MRDHSHHVEVPRHEAVQMLLEHSGFCLAPEDEIPGQRCETIPLADALNRVLAREVLAQVDVPNTRTCNMDSVAVHWADFENGIPDTSKWVRGVNWQFANTGIAMPDGFDTAIVIEHVTVSDDYSQISFDAVPSRKYAGTSAVGSKVAHGSVLAQPGQVITPDLMAKLAGGNALYATVVKKPRVVFIPTGNELQSLGASHVLMGKTLETNSGMIAAKVDAWGGTCTVLPVVPDTFEALKEALAYASGIGDIVVLNAGSSKGSDDWSVEVIEELGQVLYHQVNHGPGHHCFGGVIDGKAIIGIAGPPGGASFCADFYIRPVMMSYMGLSTEPKYVAAVLQAPFDGGHGSGVGPVMGETRPSESHPHDTFTGVKAVKVALSADGMVCAYPMKGKLGTRGTESANALYMLTQGPENPAPEVGSVIQVELREPTLLSTTAMR